MGKKPLETKQMSQWPLETAAPGMPLLLHSFDYPPNDGGIARLCSKIGTELVRKGFAVQVLTQRARDLASAINETRVTSRRPIRELSALRYLTATPPNHPVLCGTWYPEGLVALLAGVRPLIVLAHGSELLPARARWRRRLSRGLLRHVCESADLVVANSQYTCQLVRDAAPRARVVAVPLGVDHLRFKPNDSSLARQRFGIVHEFVISSVSRIHAYKGHDVVIEALSSLPEPVRRRFLYMVAGTGPNLESLRAQVARLKLDGQVRFLGFVPEQDLPDVYRASNLFILCTREVPQHQEVEGFGLVFLEAQACGTAVVGTRTGGISDAIREGDGGWLIDQDDVDALRRILLTLADRPHEFREAGSAARRRVERECTWEHYTQRVLDALAVGGIIG